MFENQIKTLVVDSRAGRAQDHYVIRINPHMSVPDYLTNVGRGGSTVCLDRERFADIRYDMDHARFTDRNGSY